MNATPRPDLSLRARTLLARRPRTWTPPPRDEIVERLRAYPLPGPPPAFVDYIERFCGHGYTTGSGYLEHSLFVPLDAPEVVVHAGHTLLALGSSNDPVQTRFLAEDGTVWAGRSPDRTRPIAGSVEVMIESDAILDEILCFEPSWSRRASAPLRVAQDCDGFERALGDLGLARVPEASDAHGTWWSSAELRVHGSPVQGWPDLWQFDFYADGVLALDRAVLALQAFGLLDPGRSYPHLSERARRMLAAGARRWTPPHREVVAYRLRAAGLPPCPAFLEFAARWAGVTYGRGRGAKMEFALDLDDPECNPGASPALLYLGQGGRFPQTLRLASDGTVWHGETEASAVLVAESIEELVEADALQDECLRLAPTWFRARSSAQVDYGPWSWPTTDLEPLAPRVGRVAARFGAELVGEASGAGGTWWSGGGIRLRIERVGPAKPVKVAVTVLAESEALLRECATALLEVGISFQTPDVQPLWLALR